MLKHRYYVDPVLGSDKYCGRSVRFPWKTLLRASQHKFGAGDVIYLKRNATHRGQLCPKGNGTAKRPIRIRPFGKGKAPLLVGRDGPALVLQDVRHWDVQSLNLTNSGKPSPALYIHGTSRHYHARLIRLSRLTACRSTGHGILADSCQDVRMENCTSKDNSGNGFMTWDSRRVSFIRCRSLNNLTGFSIGQGGPDCSITQSSATGNAGVGYQVYGVGRGKYRGHPMQTPRFRLISSIARDNVISLYMRESVNGGLIKGNTLISSGKVPSGPWWAERRPLASILLEGFDLPRRGLHGGWPSRNLFIKNRIGARRSGVLIIAQGHSSKSNQFSLNRYSRTEQRGRRRAPMFIMGGFKGKMLLPHRGAASTVHIHKKGEIRPRIYYSISEFVRDSKGNRNHR